MSSIENDDVSTDLIESEQSSTSSDVANANAAGSSSEQQQQQQPPKKRKVEGKKSFLSGFSSFMASVHRAKMFLLFSFP